MDKLPFSVYDFFGYLASGFVLLVALAASFTRSTRWQSTPHAIVATLLIVAAYATGQVVANAAGYVIETRFVAGFLGQPTSNLLTSAAPPRWRARMFPGYYRPLPAQQRVACFAKSQLDATAGEGLFYRCHAAVKERDAVATRLSTFLNLYGFCRNMAMALFIAGVCLIVGSCIGRARTGSVVPPGWCAAASLLLAIGLLYRYLKFFRQYSVEVFVSYAESV